MRSEQQGFERENTKTNWNRTQSASQPLGEDEHGGLEQRNDICAWSRQICEANRWREDAPVCVCNYIWVGRLSQ